MRRFVTVSLLVFLAIACGSRTQLFVGTHADEDGTHADGAMDLDALTDGGWEDVLPLADAPACSADTECDDGIPCTVDSCHPQLRRCVNRPDDARCDNGVFCDGNETCSVSSHGCVAGVRDCSDGVSCTVDTCNEGKRACAHAPSDLLCPISHGCDAVDGCQARAFAHDETYLYEVRLPSGKLRTLGPIGVGLTDIALHPTNRLFGIRRDGFYELNQTTGAATLRNSLANAPWTALDADANGTLYGAAGGTVYTVSAAGVANSFATYPQGHASSGDLAILQGRLVATTTRPGFATDFLVEVNLSTQASRVIGDTGYSCIWGLAAYGATLYGLTCEGRVLSINAATGATSMVTQTTIAFWGATAR